VLPSDSKVSFRFTRAQLRAIRAGLKEIVTGYYAWRNTGRSPHSRQLYIHPLSERQTQLAGRFDQELMQEIIALAADSNGNAPSGRRVRLNVIQIRAAIFAVRVGQDKVRLMACHKRKEALHIQQVFGVDKQSRYMEKQRVKRTIKSLERHMKRANKSLRANLGEAAYKDVLLRWKQHLKWVRLHLVYFRPRPPVTRGRRRAQILIIDAVVDAASRGLRERGYQLPAANRLRDLMRLAVRYGREAQSGFDHQFLARGSVAAQRYLADFVQERVKLRRMKSN
jgi:hypothetical protein